MYDKKEFPILVQLAPTDDDKEAALQAQLTVLQAENARLRELLQPFVDLSQRYKEFAVERPHVMFKDYFHYNEEYIDLLNQCIEVREALQAKEAAKE